MRLRYIPDLASLQQQVAEYICASVISRLNTHHPFNLGLATGATPIGIYRTLVPLLGASQADLSQLSTFNLDEYLGLSANHPRSYVAEMHTQFWQPLHSLNHTFDFKNTHIPDTATIHPDIECSRYEARIRHNGGIDLQILGIGTNGHIAFNEPGSRGDSRTRVVAIDEETRKVNAVKFFANDLASVPTHAITMGIGTILESKEILLIILGKSKREIFQRLMSATHPDINLPASFLLNHPNVTIYTDLQ